MAREVRGRGFVFVGGSSGIGRAAALDLARRGASILVVSRGEARGQAVAGQLRDAGAGEARWQGADLMSLAGIDAAAEAIGRWRPEISGLVHSAMDVPGFFRRSHTRDGFDLAFGLQYLARAALNRALVGQLAASGDGRVVHVGAAPPRALVPDPDDLQFTRRRWNLVASLMSSQVLGYLHAQEAARRWAHLPVGVTIAAVGPTWTETTDRQPWPVRALYRLIATTVERSAVNVIDALTRSEPLPPGSAFLDPHAPRATPIRYDPALAERIWQITDGLLAEHPRLTWAGVSAPRPPRPVDSGRDG